jgi:putative PIN family toxin of toxin-antitoxin system
VLDSNVIISGLGFGGKPREILEALRKGEIEVVISPFIVAEVRKSLGEDVHLDDTTAESSIDRLSRRCIVLDPSPEATIVAANPADNRVLDCAVQGDAEFLVTGDKRHLLPLKEYQGVKIVSPAEFLDVLSEQA